MSGALDLKGQRLGDYEILDLIGEGGTSKVWKARHVYLDKQYAIKVLEEEIAPQFENDFRREASIIAKLDHPNIVGISNFSRDPKSNIFYMVNELVEGKSLRRRLNGPVPVDQAVRIALQIADALKHTHDKGIVHGDIKPSNILVSGQTAKLADFGVAALLNKKTFTSGTPKYMSPEQKAKKPIDARSDIYSLGVVLYEMLTGKVPDALTVELDSKIPARLGKVIEKALEPLVGLRYQKIDEFIKDLESVALSMTPAPKPKPKPKTNFHKKPTMRAQAPKAASKAPVVIGIGLGVLLAVIVIIVIASSGGEKPSNPPAAAPPVVSQPQPVAEKPKVEKSATTEIVERGDAAFKEAKDLYQQAIDTVVRDVRDRLLGDALDKAETARRFYTTASELKSGDADIQERCRRSVELMKLIRDAKTTSASIPAAEVKKADPQPQSEPAPVQQPQPQPEATEQKEAAARREVLGRLIQWLEVLPPGWPTVLDGDLSQQPGHLFLAGRIVIRMIARDEWKPVPEELKVVREALALDDPLPKLVEGVKKHGSSKILRVFAYARVAELEPEQARPYAADLGITLNGGYGTPDGHARRELGAEPDAAAISKFDSLNSFELKYLKCIAMLRGAVAGSVPFDKAATQFTNLKGSRLNDHLDAFAALLRKHRPCSLCKGTGERPCGKCNGTGKLTYLCQVCKGSGVKPSTGTGCAACGGEDRIRLGGKVVKGTGRVEKACAKGVDCGACPGPWVAPTLEQLAVVKDCPICNKTGRPFEKFGYLCPECLGVGQLFTPTSDPAKGIWK